MTELVIDVGMYDGSDTAYYLARGYNVVAIEANPRLCDAARERFAAEIVAGRLTVCNVGIAEQAGQLEFWLSENSEWSSFHKEWATAGGVSASPIMVPAVRFGDLLSDYPEPLYVKIDIEGSDALCIRELGRCSSLPACISFEAHHDGAANVQLLGKLGYQAFKCVRQNDWHEITSDNIRLQGRIRAVMTAAESYRAVPRRVMAKLYYLHYGKAPLINGWSFRPGSSGPFGRELPGRWMSYDETLAVWEQLHALRLKFNKGPYGEWFDIHASMLSAAGSEMSSS